MFEVSCHEVVNEERDREIGKDEFERLKKSNPQIFPEAKEEDRASNILHHLVYGANQDN